MKVTFATVNISLLLFIFSSSAISGEITYPDDSYTSGDTLTAADLNAKFNEIKVDVNDNSNQIVTHSDNASVHHTKTTSFSELTDQATDAQIPATIARDSEVTAAISALTTYDYKNYQAGENVTQKDFNLTIDGTTGTAVWSYARLPVGDDTKVTITKTRRDDTTTPVLHYVNEYLATTDSFFWTKQDGYDPTGTTLQFSRVFSSPIQSRTSSMTVGRYWGTAATTTPDVGTIIETTTLLGIEDVTVPFGNVTGCLNIHTNRVRTWYGINISRVSWYCPNIGLVKSIQLLGGASYIWELTDVTTAP